MLILNRREGETIMIGDEVSVTVLNSNGFGQVRLGIDAPKEIPIYREELYMKIQEEKASQEDNLLSV